MDYKFNSLNEIEKFAANLRDYLTVLGNIKEAEIIHGFTYNIQTTSSEYLGELRIVLNNLAKSHTIKNKKYTMQIENLILQINEAFENEI